jgi:hypothetical protein
MIRLISQAAAQAAGFGEVFFRTAVLEREKEFLMLQRCEKSHIFLGFR